MRWLRNLFGRDVSAENTESEKKSAFDAARAGVEESSPAPLETPAAPPARPPAETDDFALRHAKAGVDVERPAAGVDLEKRAQRAAESILEDEALTADLDDTAAQALLEWGTTLAKTVAQGTVNLDETQAEPVVAERMRATRQMLRSISRSVAGPGLDADTLQRIGELAKQAFGEQAALPDSARLQAFLQQQPQAMADPAQMIAQLRDLFDQPGNV